MTTNAITRFAPSPTGRLHLGHAWSALLAHDMAREQGGQFVLRIEDIDQTRCRPEFIDAIFEDLRWLGFDWDGGAMIQSQRMPAYAEALERLDQLGLLYRCTCTRADIANAASAPQAPMEATYPGTCRDRQIAADCPLPWSWRLDVSKAMSVTGPLAWHDEGAGPVKAIPRAPGDVILARKDAGTSYHLAVTVDDAAQEVTDIVRGRDLFASTHIHRLLQELLGLPTPRYHHHKLLIGSDGERLAKRKAAPTLASLRADGMDGMKLASLMREQRFPVGFALEEA